MSRADNYMMIKTEIAKHAIKSGRSPSDITLVAVSKTHTVAVIKEVYLAGVRVFGENKVQEALAKINEIGNTMSGSIFHFIGQLQTNKVRKVVGNFDLIHSIDRQELLSGINKHALAANYTQKVLIEVNIGREKQKGGVYEEHLDALLEYGQTLPGVCVRGLMAVPPPAETPEDNRNYFKRMKELLTINSNKFDHFDILSMGMSDDYTVAIEEGATHIRIGTAIFGNRDYV